MMPVAVLVSNRPELFVRAKAAAERQGQTVAILHNGGSFAEAFNDALYQVRQLNGFAVKWDDHDLYPEDHLTQMQKLWKPKTLVYGKVSAPWGEAFSLCASAFDANIRVMSNERGQITDSVLSQLEVVKSPTSVYKNWCQCAGSWGVDCHIHKLRNNHFS